MQHTFGSLGSSFLAGLIALACLVTAVGLTCACAEYFCQRLPLSYRSLVIILAGFSFIVSNLGLTKLIQVSIPVLTAIYPRPGRWRQRSAEGRTSSVRFGSSISFLPAG